MVEPRRPEDTFGTEYAQEQQRLLQSIDDSLLNSAELLRQIRADARVTAIQVAEIAAVCKLIGFCVVVIAIPAILRSCS